MIYFVRIPPPARQGLGGGSAAAPGAGEGRQRQREIEVETEAEAAAEAGAGREAEVDTPASASDTSREIARSRYANEQPMESSREGAGRAVTGHLHFDFRFCA